LQKNLLRRPDFMVADFRLGEGTGVEAIRAVRARHGSMPALLLSGEADIAPHEPGVQVLHKPVTPDRLLQCLRQAFPERVAAAQPMGEPA
jgi:ActR/RegA family two-component response regulator